MGRLRPEPAAPQGFLVACLLPQERQGGVRDHPARQQHPQPPSPRVYCLRLVRPDARIRGPVGHRQPPAARKVTRLTPSLSVPCRCLVLLPLIGPVTPDELSDCYAISSYRSYTLYIYKLAAAPTIGEDHGKNRYIRRCASL